MTDKNPRDQNPTMKSLAIKEYCTPDQYAILTLPVPKIEQADQLLIKVHAASINPIDVKVAVGVAKRVRSEQFPFKIGYDVSGTVIAVGTEVAISSPDLTPGTEVYTRLPEECRGAVSEYVVSTISATAKKPQTISHAEAASIPLASLTTFQTFETAAEHFRDSNGLAGKTVLIPGGLSGTGTVAVQLAKRVFKAGRVVTTLSTSKIGRVNGLLGEDVLDQVIDYTKQDPLKTITPGSVDFLYDTMGQGVSYLPLMKKGGIIVSISGPPFGPELKKIMPMMPTGIRWMLNAAGGVLRFKAYMYSVTYTCQLMKPSAKDLNKLAGWIDEGKIKPVVGLKAAFGDLEKVREGCQQVYSAKGGIGKFVIEMD